MNTKYMEVSEYLVNVYFFEKMNGLRSKSFRVTGIEPVTNWFPSILMNSMLHYSQSLYQLSYTRLIHATNISQTHNFITQSQRVYTERYTYTTHIHSQNQFFMLINKNILIEHSTHNTAHQRLKQHASNTCNNTTCTVLSDNGQLQSCLDSLKNSHKNKRQYVPNDSTD